MDSATDEFIADFVDESLQILSQANSTLNQLEELIKLGQEAEQTSNLELLNELFRGIHSIKGLSGMLQLQDINNLSHYLESIFDQARNEKIELDTTSIDLFFRIVDSLTEFVEAVSENRDSGIEVNPLIAEMNALLDAANGTAPSKKSSQESLEETVAELEAASEKPSINDQIEEAPESTDSPVEEPVAEPTSPAVAENTTEPAVKKNERRTPSRENSEPKKSTETLRVDSHRIDHLMNLTGQLVIMKSRFAQLVKDLKSCIPDCELPQMIGQVCDKGTQIQNHLENQENHHDLEAETGMVVGQLMHQIRKMQDSITQLPQLKSVAEELTQGIHHLESVSENLQKCIMETRMVPIGPLFEKYRRVIRDISRNRNKQIKMVIEGEQTELDKRMIDGLSEPLIHMIRNSADHGIEAPDHRESLGKSAEGTVLLQAIQEGNEVLIKIIDDGKGIDPTAIKNKAVSKGIISQQQADRLSTERILELIWEPGFSTAEQVTDISGRGMGMDIVRKKIESLKGTIHIQSIPNQGTTFTIRLPLTMAILPSLLTKYQEQDYAFALDSVDEIVNINSSEIESIQGSKCIRVRNRVLGIVELNEMLNPHQNTIAEELDFKEKPIVVLKKEHQEIGVLVDEVCGMDDLVIKPLTENYEEVSAFSGASILGTGAISLIIDSAWLMRSSTGDLITN